MVLQTSQSPCKHTWCECSLKDSGPISQGSCPFSFIFSLKLGSSESFNPLTISLRPRLGKFERINPNISPFLISLIAIATWRGLLASAWQTDGTEQLLLQLGNVKSESPHGIMLAGLTFKPQALCAQENDCHSSHRVFHCGRKQGVQRKVVFSTFLFLSEALTLYEH